MPQILYYLPVLNNWMLIIHSIPLLSFIINFYFLQNMVSIGLKVGTEPFSIGSISPKCF